MSLFKLQLDCIHAIGLKKVQQKFQCKTFILYCSFYIYSPIMTTLLLILIFKVFTQLHVECATVFGTQKLHCLIKIHTNVFYRSFICYFPVDGPERAKACRILQQYVMVYNKTDFKCILWDASIYVMHGKYGKY